MKKAIFVIFLMAGGLVLKAQSLTEIKVYILANQYAKGKTGIDKFLSDPANANNAEAWYYKGVLYNGILRDTSKSIAEHRAENMEAFDALKKYKSLDPKEKFTRDEKNFTIFNVFYGFFDLGIKAYNGKNYDESYNNFKDALDAHDYIFSNDLENPKGIKFTSLDTDLVWNLAILGNELKKGPEVITYYKKLVDINLTDPKYLEAYEGTVVYYKDMKDQALFNQYLEKGKKNFPKEPFWEAIDVENATQGLSNVELFKKYEEMAAKYPNNYVVFFNYGIELNKFVYADGTSNADKDTYKPKIAEMFKKAIAINSTVDANMLLANYYYNNSFDLGEASGKIKGTKPEDVKKRNDLTAAAKKSMDDCMPYAEAAIDLFSKMPKLKATEKNNYKQAYDMLIEIYRVKGDAKKSAECKAKKDAI